jgi:hypothetical protein
MFVIPNLIRNLLLDGVINGRIALSALQPSSFSSFIAFYLEKILDFRLYEDWILNMAFSCLVS